MSEKLSDRIIDMVHERVGENPSLIQTGWYPVDVLMTILDKGHSEIWYNHFINDGIIRYEGVIEFTKGSTYIYYKKDDDAQQYWFVFMTNAESRDGVLFYINSIKKQKIKSVWS
jgi:hypothetical protein